MVGRREQLTLIVDQGVSSVTNFGLIAFAAKALSPADVGELALLLSTYYIVLGLMQAISGELFLVCRLTYPKNKEIADGLGLVSLLSCVAAVGILFLGWLSPVDMRSSLLLAAALPLLIVQDSLRFLSFVNGQAVRALASDVLWLFGVVAGYALLPADPSPAFVTGVWSASGALAGLVLVLISPARPNFKRPSNYWRLHGATAKHLAAEAALVLGSAQSLVFATAALVGLAEAGAVRAIMAIFGPLNVAFGALRVACIRRLQSTPQDGRPRAVYLTSTALVTITLLYGLSLVTLPDKVGVALFGATWTGVSTLIPEYLFLYVIVAASFGPYCLLRALARTRDSLVAKMITAFLTIIGVTVGAAASGTAGAILASAAATGVGLLLWSLFCRRALAGVHNLPPITAHERQAAKR